MEGKFVSALLGAVEWLGRVNQAAQTEFRQIAQKQSDAAKIELARAEALTKATNATMSQARSALINLQVERENVTGRMISASRAERGGRATRPGSNRRGDVRRPVRGRDRRCSTARWLP